MASIHTRTLGGKITQGQVTYQVRWREGGGRSGAWQSESFDTVEKAERFRALIDGYGQQWPPGWVKGLGFVTEEDGTAAAHEPLPFRDFAAMRVAKRTGVTERTRDDYRAPGDGRPSVCVRSIAA